MPFALFYKVRRWAPCQAMMLINFNSLRKSHLRDGAKGLRCYPPVIPPCFLMVGMSRLINFTASRQPMDWRI
jgi:hypothetical protein